MSARDGIVLARRRLEYGDKGAEQVAQGQGSLW